MNVLIYSYIHDKNIVKFHPLPIHIVVVGAGGATITFDVLIQRKADYNYVHIRKIKPIS